jgi:hypothetical protein
MEYTTLYKNKARSLPYGTRFGKAFAGKETTWNASTEYLSSALCGDWVGPVLAYALRINVHLKIQLTFL